MPNFPTREHTHKVPNQPQRQPQYSPHQRPVQGRPTGQSQQPRVQVQQVRYGQNPQIRTLTPPLSAERLRPMKPSSNDTKSAPTQKKRPQTAHRKKPRRQRERTTLGDFLLSFFVALFVFGVAAVFVCNALISLFT